MLASGSELVGLGSDEFVFALSDSSFALAYRWNGTRLRFGIRRRSDKGVDGVHGSLEDVQRKAKGQARSDRPA